MQRELSAYETFKNDEFYQFEPKLTFSFSFSVLTDASGGSPNGREYGHQGSDELVKAEAHDNLAVEDPGVAGVPPGERSPTDGGAYSNQLMQRYPTDEFVGAASPTSLLQSTSSHYGSANAAAHYGTGQAGSYYSGGSGSGMYPPMALQASFLYPHLYTATMSPTHHLHLSGNPGSVDGGALDEYGSMGGAVTSSGEISGHHHHQHHHHRGNQSDSQAYSSLEGDESQTGPIRGAYSARSEHGVWRPY